VTEPAGFEQWTAVHHGIGKARCQKINGQSGKADCPVLLPQRKTSCLPGTLEEEEERPGTSRIEAGTARTIVTITTKRIVRVLIRTFRGWSCQISIAALRSIAAGGEVRGAWHLCIEKFNRSQYVTLVHDNLTSFAYLLVNFPGS